MLFGLLSGIVLLGTAGIVAWAFMIKDFLLAGIDSAALILFGLVSGWMMHRAERCVNAFLGSRAGGTFSHSLMLIVAAPATQVIHFIALIRAYVLSHISWRGIHYHIRSGLEITRKIMSPSFLKQTWNNIRYSGVSPAPCSAAIHDFGGRAILRAIHVCTAPFQRPAVNKSSPSWILQTAEADCLNASVFFVF